jgi:hypothetical protein
MKFISTLIIWYSIVVTATVHAKYWWFEWKLSLTSRNKFAPERECAWKWWLIKTGLVPFFFSKHIMNSWWTYSIAYSKEWVLCYGREREILYHYVVLLAYNFFGIAANRTCHTLFFFTFFSGREWERVITVRFSYISHTFF